MSDSQSIIESTLTFVKLVYQVILVYIDVVKNFFKAPTKKSIKGQNVLITGSGHGLGREMALRFAQLQCNLALVDINEPNNESVKREIQQNRRASQVKVFTYSVDIRNETQVAELAKAVRNDLGDIDILVNNAGIVQCLPFLELSAPLVERTFQVNTMAHIWTIKHFLPSMIEKKRGHIVAISSIAGLIGAKYLTDYCASKFAVVGLMDSLDKEIHDKGANKNIHLTTVCPACMSTGMFKILTTKFSKLLPVLSPGGVAQSIIDSVLTNQSLVVLPKIALFCHRISSIVPAKANQLVQDYLDYGVKSHSK